MHSMGQLQAENKEIEENVSFWITESLVISIFKKENWNNFLIHVFVCFYCAGNLINII